MWRMTSRLSTAILSATLALVAASDARAAAVQTYAYTTSGTVGVPDTGYGSGGTVGPIGFNGVSSGTMTTPGAFNLGSFTVAALPPSVSLTYDATPYTIYLTGFGTGYTYQINGTLDGTLNGAGVSNLVARVTSVKGWGASGDLVAPFSLADLRIIAPQAITAPANLLGSQTTFLGQVGSGISPTPAPEPTSIAVLAVGLVAWGLNRRRRRAA
jgi:hypothetical protein